MGLEKLETFLYCSLTSYASLNLKEKLSVTSCFTVAKVVRDRHEADKFITKVENAKTEKFLNENGSVLSGV